MTDEILEGHGIKRTLIEERRQLFHQATAKSIGSE